MLKYNITHMSEMKKDPPKSNRVFIGLVLIMVMALFMIFLISLAIMNFLVSFKPIIVINVAVSFLALISTFFLAYIALVKINSRFFK